MRERHLWSAADTITAIRIVMSVPLIFIPLNSGYFFTIYTIAGLSDALDGYVARKTKTASAFGAKLDSIADLSLFCVLMFRFFPSLQNTIPAFIWFAAGSVALIRLSSLAVTAIKHHRFDTLHTYLNKLTGGLLFLLPYIFAFTSIVQYICILCAVAFVASVEELIIIINEKEYNLERKSIFLK